MIENIKLVNDSAYQALSYMQNARGSVFGVHEPKDPNNGTSQLPKAAILAEALHNILRLSVDWNET
jgi:hypothetical protein